MEKYDIKLRVKCFNLKDTLECGQCFRWKRVEDKEDIYVGILNDRVLKVKQEGDYLYIRSSKQEGLKEKVKKYFDLDTDYEKIEADIIKIDDNIRKALANTSGIRILNQNFFEMVMSYIISANNNIPRISKSINTLSEKYGEKVIFDDEEYYLFPDVNSLKNLKEEDYRKCSVGFRARYLKSTVKEILDGKVNLDIIKKLETKEAREQLLKLQGVGPKVADCILLFACERKEVFPVDVWVERVMHNLYFKNTVKKVRKNDILEYAKTNFGKNAGIVQQHLFHNIREGLI